MHNLRLTTTALLGTAALLAPVGTAFAAGSHAESNHQTRPQAVVKSNAQNERTTKQLMSNTSYTLVTRTYKPYPTSTKRFMGYQTIVVKSPKGTTPVDGYFKLVGAQRGSVIVTSAGVDLKRNAYVIDLHFPGEQGDPGHLIVTTVSR